MIPTIRFFNPLTARSICRISLGCLLVAGNAFLNGFFASPVHAEPSSKEEKLDLGKNLEKRGNLLDHVFGTPPPMATDRAILVVGAFLDENGNGARDGDEKWLDGEITCELGGVDYNVPAFIPGLEPERRYKLNCNGIRFQPRPRNKDIFFQRRGEILEIELACSETEKPVSFLKE